MKRKKTVFVFPCGSEIGLEIQRALAHSTHFHLIGGSSVPDHGRFAFADYVPDLPSIGEAALLPAIQALIAKREIDFIFPAHDSAVKAFSEWSEQGLLGGARVIAARAQACRIARSKKETYSVLKDVVPTPKVYASAEEVGSFPVFLKPDVGQGSKGVQKAMDRGEMLFHLRSNPSLMILEFLPGEEFTIDCFTDRNGKLRFAAGRVRTRISNGISVNTSGRDDKRFRDLAEKINGAIRMRGAWFFQLKERADGDLVLMEIAARIAGASGYQRLKGVNLPLLSLFDALGYEVEVFENHYSLEMDRQLQSHFKMDYEFDAAYFDLDDTLIEDGVVNHRLMAVLYALKSAGKKLLLITRHESRFQESARACLKKHFIDPEIFDAILEVGAEEKKSRHVIADRAIFIDDSFAERSDVARNNRLPVFDINQAIELFS